MPEQEQHRGGDDGDLVDQQHEPEAVDADHQHQQREDAVGHADRDIVLRQSDCAVGAADEHVAGGPHRDGEERDRGQQRQERADDPAVHAEVRRRGHRVVGAVARAEQRHRRQDRRAEEQPEQCGEQGVAERQAEDDREAAEHDGGDGVGAAEDQPEQIERARGAFVVGDGFDAVRLDFGDLGRCGERGCVRGGHDGPCRAVGCGVRSRKTAGEIACKRFNRYGQVSDHDMPPYARNSAPIIDYFSARSAIFMLCMTVPKNLLDKFRETGRWTRSTRRSSSLLEVDGRLTHREIARAVGSVAVGRGGPCSAAHLQRAGRDPRGRPPRGARPWRTGPRQRLSSTDPRRRSPPRIARRDDVPFLSLTRGPYGLVAEIGSASLATIDRVGVRTACDARGCRASTR